MGVAIQITSPLLIAASKNGLLYSRQNWFGVLYNSSGVFKRTNPPSFPEKSVVLGSCNSSIIFFVSISYGRCRGRSKRGRRRTEPRRIPRTAPQAAPAHTGQTPPKSPHNAIPSFSSFFNNGKPAAPAAVNLFAQAEPAAFLTTGSPLHQRPP